MRDENCPDCLKLTSGDCGKHSGTYFETKTIEDRLKTLEDKINKYEPHIINLIADTPIGVSQWKEEGIKRGYWDYFKKEVKDEIIKEINKTWFRQDITPQQVQEAISEIIYNNKKMSLESY